VGELQYGCPFLDISLIDGVLWIVEDPEEALKVNYEGILEDERAVIGGTLSKVPRGRREGKFVPKKSRVAGEEESVDTEEIVFHAKDDVSSMDVIFAMANNTIATEATEAWVRANCGVHGHCRNGDGIVTKS